MVYIAGPDAGEDFVYNGEEIADGVMRFADVDRFHTVIALLGYNDDGTQFIALHDDEYHLISRL